MDRNSLDTAPRRTENKQTVLVRVDVVLYVCENDAAAADSRPSSSTALQLSAPLSSNPIYSINADASTMSAEGPRQ